MKVLVLYRPNSDHGQTVDEFIHNLRSRSASQHIEVLSIDTREGSAMATLYDVMQYPAVLVMQTNGYVQQVWQGEALPLIDEVVAYASS